MEAGLCLYGNDIDENTSPIEAGLAFVVGKLMRKSLIVNRLAKRRREAMDFPGAKKIVDQLKNKSWPKRRVGLICDSGRAPRPHLPLIDPINKAAIGFVTSGCPSPTLGKLVKIFYSCFR